MIINSYNVNMNSSRKSKTIFEKETEEKKTQKNSNIVVKSHSKDLLTISEEAQEFLNKSRNQIKNSDYQKENDLEQQTKYKNNETDEKKSNVNLNANSIFASNNVGDISTIDFECKESMHLKILLRILESLTGKKNLLKDFEENLNDFSDMKNDIKQLKLNSRNLIKPNNKDTNKNINGDQLIVENDSVWKVEKRESIFIKEQEVTAFSSTGLVKTADGREISFNVNFEMSRNFETYIEKYTSEEIVIKDPLVINLEDAPANISDKTFFFDIDSDGDEDEISELGKGSGFLAFDKNNDGVINNGNELFGAKTGNGFAELKRFDDDGNGWIDEADSIFEKLKVWTKDEDGKDILLSLKEADLGAIYLNSVGTEFSVKNSETNEQNAQVRSTGVYLKESGGVGSIQQIDFAIKN